MVMLTQRALFYARGGAELEGISPDEWASRFIVESLHGTFEGLELEHAIASPVANLFRGKGKFSVVDPSDSVPPRSPSS